MALGHGKRNRRALPKPQPSPKKTSPEDLLDKSSSERPTRSSKTAAYKNQVWLGSAPKGSAAPSSEAVNEPLSGRKRPAASADAPRKRTKKVPLEGDVDWQDDDEQPARGRHNRSSSTVVAADIESPVKTRKSAKSAADSDSHVLFDDEAQDSQDSQWEEEDERDIDAGDLDLDGLDDSTLSSTLEMERPQWSGDLFGDNEEPRARSPVALTPPHIKAAHRLRLGAIVESESSDDDPAVRGGLAGLKAAQARVKPTPKPRAVRKQTAVDPRTDSPFIDLEKVAPSQKKSGRREQVRRETESSARASSSARAQHTTSVVPSRAPTPPSTSTPFHLIYTYQGRVNLKDQTKDVQDLLQVSIAHNAGLYVVRGFYPDHSARVHNAVDALTRSARDLSPGLVTMMRDQITREACAGVLHQRVSNLRGGFKSTSDSIVHPDYAVSADTRDRAAVLLVGQVFIYPLKAPTIDPLTGDAIPGQPDRKRPFFHKAIARVIAHLFKKSRGRDSLGEQIVDLLPRDLDGKPKATAPLIAVACAAIRSTLDDYSHTPYARTDFDGHRVEESYHLYMRLLAEVEQRKPALYSELMEYTLKNASVDSTLNPTAAPSSTEQEAFALLDLD
ncbi:hypothetical protein C8F01DRAFT_1130067 [Mycena amicta]|nr:hypothetical protein C8F01DRAFT_1130067 [Mycena amicta]